MEFACGVSKSKIIVVLGHSKCGAVVSACSNYTGGHITGLLSKIKPAIELETFTKIDRNGSNMRFVNNVSEINVHFTMEQIRQKSPLLNDLEKEGKILIVGGYYDIETGEVSFYER